MYLDWVGAVNIMIFTFITGRGGFFFFLPVSALLPSWNFSFSIISSTFFDMALTWLKIRSSRSLYVYRPPTFKVRPTENSFSLSSSRTSMCWKMPSDTFQVTAR